MRITVFTPTYNRAYIIENLYRSLQAQTFKDFEWLVIDDGSNDNTKELFDKWNLDMNLFSIRYYRFENCGKQKEINRALDLAKGELFFTVDSDDVLTPDALALIDKWEKTIPSNSMYCGFAGSDGDMQGKVTNPIFNKPFVDVTFFDRDPASSNFIGYDRPWVFYTEIHKKYKYPEFEDETFITEAVVWNRMANDGYKIRCFDDVIYLWEHQENGLTDGIQKTLINNPRGYGLWVKELIRFLNYNPIQKFKRRYSFYCDMCNTYNLREIVEFLDVPMWQLLIIDLMFKIKQRS